MHGISTPCAGVPHLRTTRQVPTRDLDMYIIALCGVHAKEVCKRDGMSPLGLTQVGFTGIELAICNALDIGAKVGFDSLAPPCDSPVVASVRAREGRAAAPACHGHTVFAVHFARELVELVSDGAREWRTRWRPAAVPTVPPCCHHYSLLLVVVTPWLAPSNASRRQPLRSVAALPLLPHASPCRAVHACPALTATHHHSHNHVAACLSPTPHTRTNKRSYSDPTCQPVTLHMT